MIHPLTRVLRPVQSHLHIIHLVYSHLEESSLDVGLVAGDAMLGAHVRVGGEDGPVEAEDRPGEVEGDEA